MDAPKSSGSAGDCFSQFQYPADLPPQCPEIGCFGKLSVQCSDRRNPHLLKMSDCPYRWMVSCTSCSNTWHACHFGCGHLRKRNKTGSSEISRHENGRTGLHQRGVRASCPLNPNPARLATAQDIESQQLNTWIGDQGIISASTANELDALDVTGEDLADSDFAEIAELLGTAGEKKKAKKKRAASRLAEDGRKYCKNPRMKQEQRGKKVLTSEDLAIPDEFFQMSEQTPQQIPQLMPQLMPQPMPQQQMSQRQMSELMSALMSQQQTMSQQHQLTQQMAQQMAQQHLSQQLMSQQMVENADEERMLSVDQTTVEKLTKTQQRQKFLAPENDQRHANTAASEYQLLGDFSAVGMHRRNFSQKKPTPEHQARSSKRAAMDESVILQAQWSKMLKGFFRPKIRTLLMYICILTVACDCAGLVHTKDYPLPELALTVISLAAHAIGFCACIVEQGLGFNLLATPAIRQLVQKSLTLLPIIFSCWILFMPSSYTPFGDLKDDWTLLSYVLDASYHLVVMTTLGNCSPHMLWLAQALYLGKYIYLRGLTCELVLVAVVWGKLALHHCFLKNLERENRVKVRFDRTFVASPVELSQRQRFSEEDFQQAKWEKWVTFGERTAKYQLGFSAAPFVFLGLVSIHKYLCVTEARSIAGGIAGGGIAGSNIAPDAASAGTSHAQPGPLDAYTVMGYWTDSVVQTLVLGVHVAGWINLKDFRFATHLSAGLLVPSLKVLALCQLLFVWYSTEKIQSEATLFGALLVSTYRASLVSFYLLQPTFVSFPPLWTIVSRVGFTVVPCVLLLAQCYFSSKDVIWMQKVTFLCMRACFWLWVHALYQDHLCRELFVRGKLEKSYAQGLVQASAAIM